MKTLADWLQESVKRQFPSRAKNSRLLVSFTSFPVHLLHTITKIHEGLISQRIATKRDIFYGDVASYQRQSFLDADIEVLACTLGREISMTTQEFPGKVSMSLPLQEASPLVR